MLLPPAILKLFLCAQENDNNNNNILYTWTAVTTSVLSSLYCATTLMRLTVVMSI